MLEKLTITRFKSIYEQTLEFGNSNLFIGVNGAGKSNILEALGVLSACIKRGLEPSVLGDKGVRLSLPTLFKSSFRNTRLSPQFSLAAKFRHGEYRCSVRAGTSRGSLEIHSEALFDGNEKVFGRGPNGIRINEKFVDAELVAPGGFDPTRGLWDIVAPFCSVSEGLRADLDEFSNFIIYSPQTAVMRGLAIETRPIEPLGLSGGGLASAFNSALIIKDRSTGIEKKMLEEILSLVWQPGWANQIKIRGFDSNVVPTSVKSDGLMLYIRDKYMSTNRNLLSAFDASEGTLYLIFVAALLMHDDTPNTFALDNVDGTLNAALVRKLTAAVVNACEGSKKRDAGSAYQSFVTSHHPSALDSFDIFSDSQKVFVARRADGKPAVGATYFDELKPPANVSKDEWVRRQDGRMLSELLLEGKIPGALR